MKLQQYLSWRDRFVAAWLIPLLEEELARHNVEIPREALFKATQRSMQRAAREWDKTAPDEDEVDMSHLEMIQLAR